MSAKNKYISIFGRIDSLAEQQPWSTGVSNMLEWLTWSTGHVLGVTKTNYRKQIVAWSHDEDVRGASLEQKQDYVANKVSDELKRTEQSERHTRPSTSIATPREALRRAKYFSEDYLNKEFDIFWTLVSDIYLDRFYAQFTAINGGGAWATHGNSGIFAKSTGISEMQMDNLSYNDSERLLVANELKLGGRKNPDQILKYALMVRLLRERGFIHPEARFLLLFIGDKKDTATDWNRLIEDELVFCRSSPKSTSAAVCQDSVLEIARTAEYASTTWGEMMSFNQTYMPTLDAVRQQVERKLLDGFNHTLASKQFMRVLD